ncbi:MAG TPA: LPS export ABC transporter permease LptF [Rhizomicrobium sp.]|jgi:lipopolysaccharide export system permease protein|nr:LPS export ABC transporter permease LptF [Rhizomicrobium sp.]
MPRISIYVLRQLIGPIALFAFLMACVVWLSQSLRLLDLVINRGQSAPTFVYLTLLLLPSLLVIILPIAFFAGTLYGLHRLNADSELVVMWSSGYSRAQLAVPVFIAATVLAALTYLCGLYLMPLGERMMKDKVYDIRADIGAAVLNEGQFNTPANGLTVFIRELSSDGHIRGVLVHDDRKAQKPITYLAESGQLAQTPGGARLIMRDGTIEQTSAAGGELSVLKFQRYVFDLDQFGGQQRESERETSERYLPELLWPKFKKDPGQRVRDVYFAEAHNRLSQPLYCFAFALIALAAVTRGRRGRGAYAVRLTVASLLAVALRIAGYGAIGIASRSPPMCALLYAIPLIGCAAAIADMAGFEPLEILARFFPGKSVEARP